MTNSSSAAHHPVRKSDLILKLRRRPQQNPEQGRRKEDPPGSAPLRAFLENLAAPDPLPGPLFFVPYERRCPLLVLMPVNDRRPSRCQYRRVTIHRREAVHALEHRRLDRGRSSGHCALWNLAGIPRDRRVDVPTLKSERISLSQARSRWSISHRFPPCSAAS
jgi:hypothetical protein